MSKPKIKDIIASINSGVKNYSSYYSGMPLEDDLKYLVKVVRAEAREKERKLREQYAEACDNLHSSTDVEHYGGNDV